MPRLSRISRNASLSSLLILVLALADLLVGSSGVSLHDLTSGDTIAREIFLNLRLPRILTAICAGAALSAAGLLMQTLFRNALAGPFILGISSGSTLGVALVTLAATLLGFTTVNQWLTILAGILGAFLVLLMVLGVSRRVRQSVSLLIIGLMVGNIASALVNVLQNQADPDSLKLFITWTFGSLTCTGWPQLALLLPLTALGLVLSILLIKPLNGLLLGENYAQSLGIQLTRTRFLIILSTGLLAGAITAFTGPIAFIGVAVPHIARGLCQSSDHRLILPTSILMGIALMLACDIISQSCTYALPISTVTALFGAPIIIYIILRK